MSFLTPTSSSLTPQQPINVAAQLQNMNYSLAGAMRNFRLITAEGESETAAALKYIQNLETIIQATRTALEGNSRLSVSLIPRGINAHASSMYTGPDLYAPQLGELNANFQTPSASSTPSSFVSPSLELSAEQTPVDQDLIKVDDPFEFTASKLGIPVEFLRSQFAELQAFYDSSTLTNVCGVKIIQDIDTAIEHPSTSFVMYIQQLMPGFSQEAYDQLFVYEFKNGKYTCIVKYEGEKIGTFTHTEKAVAKKEAIRQALQIKKHPLHFVKNLVKIPLESPQEKSDLISFFQIKSLHTNGDALQSCYKILTRNDVGDPTSWEFITRFKKIEISTAKGETQAEARKEGYKKILRVFDRIVQMPKEVYLKNLQTQAEIIRGETVKNALVQITVLPIDLISMVIQYLHNNPSAIAKYEDIDVNKEPDAKKDSDEKKRED